MPSRTRTVAGFLVAPLVGTFFCLLLMSLLDIPRGAHRAPLYPVVVYPIFFAPPIFLATLVVGVAAYFILRRLRRLRPEYLIGVFSTVATMIIIAIFLSGRSGRIAWEWFLIYPLTGAVIGAVLARFVVPGGRKAGYS
jgi:hypothetical protein